MKYRPMNGHVIMICGYRHYRRCPRVQVMLHFSAEIKTMEENSSEKPLLRREE
jgi:hypothetical protein